MNILITGSAGRIGRHIYVNLIRSHHVVGFDISPCSTVDHVGDIRDPIAVKKALEGIDVVVHCAALHAPHIGIRSDAEFMAINVEATKQLAVVAMEQGIQHFVYTSTTALYGHASTPADRAGWVTEQLTPQPKTIYHTSKIQAEVELQSLAMEFSTPVTVLQIARCFPEPADKMAWYRLSRGIDARDVASAHACAIKVRPSGFRRYIIAAATPFLNYATEKLYTQADNMVRESVPELAKIFSQRGWVLPTQCDRVYDSSLAQKELGWKPIYGYQEVLNMLDNGIAEVLPVSQRS